ncbi:hypothetical protein CGMCC3_g14601 [Colletotrichum fructicola]|nr:uncharacterized protein CGMCC3_g14601 [Colletotrichum fructicola]KAE9569237.1 hypothetical protein CGMCC3_g14601 [Colletotrichum fructicola]
MSALVALIVHVSSPAVSTDAAGSSICRWPATPVKPSFKKFCSGSANNCKC